MIPRFASLVLFIATTIHHVQASYDPAARTCDYICLTSFHWCSTSAVSDSGMTGCSFPAYAYPYFNRDSGSNPAMLLFSEDYNITWKAADPDYPVLIEWSFPNNSALSTTSVQWGVNTTNSSYLFSPGTIIRDQFPTSFAPDMSTDEAKWRAGSIVNSIRISQPEKPGYPYTSGDVEYTWADWSQQFTVQSATVVEFMEAMADARSQSVDGTWRRGVGIGVGVGVPVLLALTALAVWFLAKRRYASKAVGKHDVPHAKP